MLSELAAAGIDTSTYSFDSITIPGMVGAVIHWAKKNPRFSWIGDQNVAVTRLISIAAASLTAAGMSIDWTQEATGLAITLHGVSVASALTFLYHIGQSYFVQTAVVTGLDIRQTQKELKPAIIATAINTGTGTGDGQPVIPVVPVVTPKP